MSPSDDFVEKAFQPEADEAFLALITLEHADLAETIRVVNDEDPIVSRGNEYLACPFSVRFPDSTDQGPPTGQIRIDNVSQDVVKSLRLVSDGISITMEIIAAGNPDIVEASYPGFVLNRVRANVQTVTGSVGLDDLRVEPFPAESFTPGLFPGLFP